ncbi:MAG: hypothetical protein LUC34_02525 [Campylobacter sp.]|nr:hypothetical protein [Campylobacter sp.]
MKSNQDFSDYIVDNKKLSKIEELIKKQNNAFEAELKAIRGGPKLFGAFVFITIQVLSYFGVAGLLEWVTHGKRDMSGDIPLITFMFASTLAVFVVYWLNKLLSKRCINRAVDNPKSLYVLALRPRSLITKREKAKHDLQFLAKVINNHVSGGRYASEAQVALWLEVVINCYKPNDKGLIEKVVTTFELFREDKLSEASTLSYVVAVAILKGIISIILFGGAAFYIYPNSFLGIAIGTLGWLYLLSVSAGEYKVTSLSDDDYYEALALDIKFISGYTPRFKNEEDGPYVARIIYKHFGFSARGEDVIGLIRAFMVYKKTKGK